MFKIVKKLVTLSHCKMAEIISNEKEIMNINVGYMMKSLPN